MKLSINKSFQNISDHFFILSGVAYGLPFIYYLLLTLRDGDIHFLEWKKTQYLVNYFDYGFIKRGLVGNLFILLPTDHIKYYVVLFHTILFFGFIWLIARLTDKNSYPPHTSQSLNAIRVILVLSPFGALQFGYDVGRYDLLNLILLVISIQVIQRQQFLLASVLSVLALLTHEAYLFYGVPLTFALMLQTSHLFKYDHSRFLTLSFNMACHVIFVASTALVLYVFGGRKLALGPDVGLGQQVWNRDLLEPSFGANAAETTTLIAILALIYLWLLAFYRANNGKPDALLLTVLAPTALFFLGWDYARWTGLIFTAGLLIVYYKLTVNKWQFNHWALRYGGLLFLLPLGPIGVERFFPFMIQIFPLFKRLYT